MLLLSGDMEKEEEKVHCEVHREVPMEEVHREAHGQQRGGGINELRRQCAAPQRHPPSRLRNVQPVEILVWTLCCIDLMLTQPTQQLLENQLATGVRN